MRKPPPHRQRGLTLIEALFASRPLDRRARAAALPARVAPARRVRAPARRGGAAGPAGNRRPARLCHARRVRRDRHACLHDRARRLGSPRYAPQRRVDAPARLGAKAIEVIVAWTDRQGAAQQVALALVAGEEPAGRGQPAAALSRGLRANPVHERCALPHAHARGPSAAEQSIGLTEPNLRVGCVIVAPDGRVLGRGRTQQAGGPHAEGDGAARRRGAPRDRARRHRLRDAGTLRSRRRTPPCCDALIEAGPPAW